MSERICSVRATRPGDLHLLRRFYDELYVREFPDADEREELATIEHHLALKAAGRYGANNYQVLIFTDGEQVVAGSISDYLAGPDAGVIEFLVVAPGRRSRGTGRRVLTETERRLRADAESAGGRLQCVYAEVDDPARAGPGTFDPRARLRVWHRWGYRAVEFPYVQPALSAGQSPVDGLLLVVKADSPELAHDLPARHVAEVVAEYMRWAMRIPEPERNAEYRRMRQYLDGRDRVATRPLVAPDHPVCVREIRDPRDPDLDRLIRVYEGVFADPSTAVPGEEFRTLLGAARDPAAPDFDYHLWALHAAPGAELEGMVSFATLSGAGFVGYICLTGSLLGTGRVRGVLDQVEAHLVRDRPGVHGWYAECAGEPERSVFRRVGFAELAVSYSQPASTSGSLPEHALHLMYKPIGPAGPPRLSAAACLTDVGDIYRDIYDIPRPTSTSAYRRLAQALDGVAEVPVLDTAAVTRR